jgi:hypothetical protein
METFKLLLAGGREFYDYDMFKYKVDFLTQNKTNIEIVSGGAMGTDTLAERYAKEKGYKLTVIKADWEASFKSAGPIRNSKLVAIADAALFFWDRVSRGTYDCMQKASTKGIPLKVIRYDNLPLIANIGFKKYFPREAYKNHNNKPLTCLKHLDNWIASFEKRGLKVIDIDYKFDKESYETRS